MEEHEAATPVDMRTSLPEVGLEEFIPTIAEVSSKCHEPYHSQGRSAQGCCCATPRRAGALPGRSRGVRFRMVRLAKCQHRVLHGGTAGCVGSDQLHRIESLVPFSKVGSLAFFLSIVSVCGEQLNIMHSSKAWHSCPGFFLLLCTTKEQSSTVAERGQVPPRLSICTISSTGRGRADFLRKATLRNLLVHACTKVFICFNYVYEMLVGFCTFEGCSGCLGCSLLKEADVVPP